jgi:hypothetical protein
MRIAFLVILIAAGFAFFGTTEASAGDGCGRGRHFSKYRGHCVWNSARGYGYQPTIVYGYPAPYPGYGYPYRGYYWGWWGW